MSKEPKPVETAMHPIGEAPVVGDLDALYTRYGDMLYRLALVRTRNVSDAEDILQEVFLRYCRKNPTFTSAEHQKAWLITVTINCSKNLVGNAFRRHTVGIDAAGEQADEDVSFDNTVYEAVLRLPDKLRTVIHLYYYEDYAVKEIAKMLQANESTVKSWLHRARGILKEDLKGDYFDV